MQSIYVQLMQLILPFLVT